jgi:hypothetical protein
VAKPYTSSGGGLGDERRRIASDSQIDESTVDEDMIGGDKSN